MKYLFAYFAVLLLSISGCSTQNSSKNNPNIVLITIDALRADHLSCYGYERETSPNIDKIAEQGILFKNVIAPSSWTAPSMVSLFTSTYPTNHEVIHGAGYRKNITAYVQEVFSDKLTTLAEALKKQGYSTFGVSSNLHLSGKFGFDRGFDHFECLPWVDAQKVNEAIYSLEDEVKKSDKFFIWLHYFDPHSPYHARFPWIKQYAPQTPLSELEIFIKPLFMLEEYIPLFHENQNKLKNLVALYDSEINYVDSYLEEFIKRFKLNKNSLIIITSDHGEEFLEHGSLEHAKNLYRETIHVPMIIKLPTSDKKEIVNKHVTLVDIMPSILYILEHRIPDQTLGKSFFKMETPLFWQERLVVDENETEYILSELNTESILKTIITHKWKYIFNYKNNIDQLYSVTSDPYDHNNLANKNPKQCEQLKKELLDWVSTSKRYPAKIQEFSQEEEEKLKAMGYLDAQEMEVDR